MSKITLNGVDYAGGSSGGSGGHTIYDKDGNELAQEIGLQFTGSVNVTDDAVNGRTVVNISGGGGGGDTYNVYGAFIDTANVIVSRTSYHGNDSYTATEDCFVSYEVACPANDNAYVEIDGVAVCEFYFPMVCFASDNIPLKAGQTISFSNAYSGYSSYYTVYGITQGTSQVGHHYSTSEQVIGTWIDGKPLYEKTYILGSAVVANANQWNTISGMTLQGTEDLIVDTKVYLSADNSINCFGFGKANGTSFQFFTPLLLSVGGFIIQYTKTTD